MNDAYDTIEEILKEILSKMGASYTNISRKKAAGQTVYAIEAPDARPLIGTHGDTLFAIDTLVKKIAEKRVGTPKETPEESASEDTAPNRPQFLVDVNDYRGKQIKDLETKALMMAERARSFQYDVELTPMSSYERLIIHTVLSDAPNVKTESQGEGRNRRVVIKYAASQS